MKGHPIELNGETRNLKEWAKVYKINYSTVRQRLDDGMTLLDALTKPVKTKNVFATLHGETRRIREWAKIYNIDPSTVNWRISTGMTPLEALTKPTHRCATIVALDESRTTIQWARAAGLTPFGLYSRRKRGLKGEDLIAPRKTSRGLKAFGRTQSYVAWGKEYNISNTTLRDRIVRLGMKPEMALTIPVDQSRSKKHRLLTAFGETKPYGEWCEMYNISMRMLIHRLTKRKPPMSPEEALLTPLDPDRSKRKK